MIRVWFHRGAAALYVAVAVSTGTSDGADLPRSNAHGLAQAYCDALHTLPAQRKQECCGRAFPSLAPACTQELGASLERGAVALDGTAVDRCAQEAARQLEGCNWVTPLTPPVPDACRAIVAGKVASGAACRSSLECLDGLHCRGARPGQAGVCAPPGTAGTRCDVPADNLAAFTGFREDPRHPVCDGLCVKGQCLPFVPAGGACQSTGQCARGLNCMSGRCQDRPLPKAGETCAGDITCAAGSFCQAGHCAPAKGEGEPCASPAECMAFQCVMAPGAKSGTCGSPCAPAVGLAPKPPAR